LVQNTQDFSTNHVADNNKTKHNNQDPHKILNNH